MFSEKRRTKRCASRGTAGGCMECLIDFDGRALVSLVGGRALSPHSCRKPDVIHQPFKELLARKVRGYFLTSSGASTSSHTQTLPANAEEGGDSMSASTHLIVAPNLYCAEENSREWRVIQCASSARSSSRNGRKLVAFVCSWRDLPGHVPFFKVGPQRFSAPDRPAIQEQGCKKFSAFLSINYFFKDTWMPLFSFDPRSSCWPDTGANPRMFCKKNGYMDLQGPVDTWTNLQLCLFCKIAGRFRYHSSIQATSYSWDTFGCTNSRGLEQKDLWGMGDLCPLLSYR